MRLPYRYDQRANTCKSVLSFGPKAFSESTTYQDLLTVESDAEAAADVVSDKVQIEAS